MSVCDIHVGDEIEVVDEVDGTVYVFTATPWATAEELVDRWAFEGEDIYRTSYPARLSDSVNMGMDDLRKALPTVWAPTPTPSTISR